MVNISSHPAGLFWEYGASPFRVVIFPYSLTAIYPQGTEASSWRQRRHEIDSTPLNAEWICIESPQRKHTLTQTSPALVGLLALC